MVLFATRHTADILRRELCEQYVLPLMPKRATLNFRLTCTQTQSDVLHTTTAPPVDVAITKGYGDTNANAVTKTGLLKPVPALTASAAG